MLLKQAELFDLFAYDPRGGLISRVRRGLWYPGKEVGQKGRNGYRIIRYRGKVHLVHRLVWVLFYGDIAPSDIIDHINGTPTDNRISNLRLGTRLENHHNLKLYRNNTSGVPGVHWCRTSERWKAHIRERGRRHSLGSFPTFQAAVAARKRAEGFFNFKPEHGRRVVQSSAA